jgi:hypothetical protein
MNAGLVFVLFQFALDTIGLVKHFDLKPKLKDN